MGVNYYLTGPDGSGKTTLLNAITSRLQELDQQGTHIWIRSPKIISKPLMLFCRLFGLTSYKTINGIKYGRHDFFKSRFISWLFPILQLIDFKIKWSIIHWKNRNNYPLLFDRFAIDTLADLMIDTKKFDLHKRKIGKAFLRAIPEKTIIITVSTKEETIRSRKIDTLHDENLLTKIKVYEILSSDLNIPILDNNREIETVVKDLLRNIKLNARP